MESEESRKNVIEIAETSRQVMQLKVVHLSNKDSEENMKIFFVNRREDSFEKLFDMVCQEFFPGNDKARNNLRLRAYNV